MQISIIFRNFVAEIDIGVNLNNAWRQREARSWQIVTDWNSDNWINQRLQSIEMRKELTDEWKTRGIELEQDAERSQKKAVQLLATLEEI